MDWVLEIVKTLIVCGAILVGVRWFKDTMLAITHDQVNDQTIHFPKELRVVVDHTKPHADQTAKDAQAARREATKKRRDEAAALGGKPPKGAWGKK